MFVTRSRARIRGRAVCTRSYDGRRMDNATNASVPQFWQQRPGERLVWPAVERRLRRSRRALLHQKHALFLHESAYRLVADDEQIVRDELNVLVPAPASVSNTAPDPRVGRRTRRFRYRPCPPVRGRTRGSPGWARGLHRGVSGRQDDARARRTHVVRRPFLVVLDLLQQRVVPRGQGLQHAFAEVPLHRVCVPAEGVNDGARRRLDKHQPHPFANSCSCGERRANSSSSLMVCNTCSSICAASREPQPRAWRMQPTRLCQPHSQVRAQQVLDAVEVHPVAGGACEAQTTRRSGAGRRPVQVCCQAVLCVACLLKQQPFLQAAASEARQSEREQAACREARLSSGKVAAARARRA